MTAKRKQRSKKQRFELFKRDGFTCQYCGAHPPAVVLVLDHIVPFAEGGSCSDDNLITSCETCNQGKGARSLDSAPVSMAVKATEVAEREAQLRGYYEVMEAQRDRIEEDAWKVAHVFMDRFDLESIRRDWMQSIRTFNARLGRYVVLDAMEIACAAKHYEKPCFLYFCGICWHRIRELE